MIIIVWGKTSWCSRFGTRPTHDPKQLLCTHGCLFETRVMESRGE